MTLRRAVFLPFLCLLLSAEAALSAPPQEALKVPFELLKTQHMVVQAKINGKGPYRLIFDTGAPVTLINNKLAKEAGVIPKGYKKPLFAPFGSAGQFKINELELGEVKAKDLPTMVMDHPTVSLMAKFVGPIDGIIGMSFFGRYRMTIDYQKKEMTFAPGTFQPPDMISRMMKMMLAPRGQADKKVVAPAGLWGFEVAKEEGDTKPGVTVTKVLDGSPAAKGKLRSGDRLLVLNGYWTDSVLDCYTAAASVEPGATARMMIQRGGKKMQVSIQVRAGL